MHRARPVGLLLVALGMVLTSIGVSLPPERGTRAEPAIVPAAVVGWPPSSGLAIAEVVTGGGSASDEYVELTNAGSVTLDLAGIEIAYVSAAGTGASRKILWSVSRFLDPGQHLLAANAAGVYGASADATWSGGIAATGGTIVLRTFAGTVIDAVGWGDATNAWVEGSPALAPPAGSSIERRPGGGLGNGADTNDNALDWFVQPAPVPEGLFVPLTSPSPGPSASPSPSPSPSPGPTESAAPTAEPTTEPTAAPSAVTTAPPTVTPTPVISAPPTSEPTPVVTPTPTEAPGSLPPIIATVPPTSTPELTPTPIPTAEPTPQPTAEPTPAPTAEPTPAPSATPVPTAEPTTAPSATPSPSPIAEVTPIAIARFLPDGAIATVEGVLTTPIGALESGRGGFVQDETAGIALYLDGPASLAYPAGVVIRATGTLGTRFGQRVLRLPESAITVLASDELPTPVARTTGAINEEDEGRRVVVEGRVIGAPDALVEGQAIDVDDGSGAVRVVIATAAVPGGLVSGALVRATGPVGQRDPGSGGGYRVHVTTGSELNVLAPPPTPTPKPTATPMPTSAPTPSPSPKPTASPSATPGAPLATISISDARAMAIGTTVRFDGVVTIAPGGLGSLDLLAIQDDTAGIVVRLSAPANLSIGTRLEVTGRLAAPYGQLEVRPDEDGWTNLGSGPVPSPTPLRRGLGDGDEGRLVTVEGTATASPTKGEAGDFSVSVDVAGATVAVRADGTSGVQPDMLSRGGRYRLTGVVGQRASSTGRADGYRLWLRIPADVERLDAPASASPSESASTRPPGATPRATRGATPDPMRGASARPAPPLLTIGRAIAAGGLVRIEGTVTAPPGLLDGDGRLVVVQDRSGAVAVRLSEGTSVRVNDRLRVVGEMGRAYGAPRVAADEITGLGRGTSPAPAILREGPNAALEWRLATLTGVIGRVTRDGDRWRAEVRVGGASLVLEGLPGAAIPATALTKGSRITATGIVRRPHPSASDRRFTVVLRSPADLHVGAAAGGGSPGASAPGRLGSAPPRTTGATRPSGRLGGDASGGAPSAPVADTADPGVLDVELAALAGSIGRAVRVGGLVVEVRSDAVVVDDGSAQGLVLVAPIAAPVLAVLQPGDALNATGTVVAEPELAVRVDAPDGLVPVSAVHRITGVDDDPGPGAGAAWPEGRTPDPAPGEPSDPSDPAATATRRPVDVVLFGLGLASAGAVLLAVLRRRRPASQPEGGGSASAA